MSAAAPTTAPARAPGALAARLLTPSPDVGSMLIMMAPLIVLYYVSVGIAYFIGPKVEAEDEKAAAEAG